MGHSIGTGGVLLFQAAFSYAIILAGTGNGSFIGLGATLLPLLGFQSLQSPICRLSTPTARVRLNPTLAAYRFSRWRCQWCTWHSLFSFPCSDCSFIERVRLRPNCPLSLKYAVNCYSARKISYVGCYLTWRPWPLAPAPLALRQQFSAFRQRSPSRLWTGVR